MEKQRGENRKPRGRDTKIWIETVREKHRERDRKKTWGKFQKERDRKRGVRRDKQLRRDNGGRQRTWGRDKGQHIWWIDRGLNTNRERDRGVDNGDTERKR